jgi:hypothetical protein
MTASCTSRSDPSRERFLESFIGLDSTQENVVHAISGNGLSEKVPRLLLKLWTFAPPDRPQAEVRRASWHG